jgi:hypothetical protein
MSNVRDTHITITNIHCCYDRGHMQGSLAYPPLGRRVMVFLCGPLDICESAGVRLSCHGSGLAIAVSPAGSIGSCCGEVMLVDRSHSSNRQVWAITCGVRLSCRVRLPVYHQRCWDRFFSTMGVETVCLALGGFHIWAGRPPLTWEPPTVPNRQSQLLQS